MSQAMTHRGQIKALALAVNDTLGAYIGVHDAIFRDAARFKSFLKNLVGRGVPMSSLLQQAEALVPVWDGLQHRLVEFHRPSYSLLSPDERRYFDLLSRYVDAVRDTVSALVDRQRLLSQGSMGGSGNPMTWEALQQKQRVYEESIRRYTGIGEQLTAAGPIIFR